MTNQLLQLSMLSLLITAVSSPLLAGDSQRVEVADFYGFEQRLQTWKGCKVEVIVPKEVDPKRRWVWLGFYTSNVSKGFAQAMLKQGFHVVGLRPRVNSWSPAHVEVKNEFYKWAVECYKLSNKVVLAGFSQGGIAAYNWAVRNPEKVAAIHGDAPVCDVKSWPCGLGKAKMKKNAQKKLQAVLDDYGFKTVQDLQAYKENPVDLLDGLIRHKVPIIHVVGDKDMGVPVAENTTVIEKRYHEFGGEMEVIHKPDVGHKHGLEDYTDVVTFILKNGRWK